MKPRMCKAFAILVIVVVDLAFAQPGPGALRVSDGIGRRPSSASLIERSRMRAELSLDQWALYQAYVLRDPARLPAEFRGSGFEKCGTWIVEEIQGSWSRLSPDTRSALMTIGWSTYGTLARPTGLDSIRATAHFVIHYSVVPGDTNAVPVTDLDGNGTPDYIDTIATTIEFVWNYEITTMGYVPPPPDGAAGGDNFYDVYVYKLPSRKYGAVVPENDVGDNPNSVSVTESHAFTSYLELRNDYTGFPTTGTAAIEVTCAHEFYHAIEDGYDRFEMSWMSEATATWCEDEVYTDINDNYQYLRNWFTYPQIALDANSTDFTYSSHWYGSWIFFRYLSEHLTGNRYNVRRIMEHLLDYDNTSGDHSFDEIGAALTERGTNFTREFREFAAANATLIISPYKYKEGAAYPSLSRAIILSDTTIQDTIYRHASRYYQVSPAMLPSCAQNLEVSLTPIDALANFGVEIVSCKDGYATVTPIHDIFELASSETPDSLFIVVMNFDFTGTTRDYSLHIRKQVRGNSYALTDLGAIGSSGSIKAVNNLGHAAGTLYSFSGGFSSYTPVKWEGGSIRYLGSDGSAWDINNKEEAVGSLRVPFGNHAYYWGPAGSISIDTVTAGQSGARAINDSGIAVGVAKFPFNGGTETNSQPFIWSNHQMSKLPVNLDTSAIGGEALDINNHDDIIGWVYLSRSPWNRPALWSGGGGSPQDLGTMNPQRINDLGQIVGNADFDVSFDGMTDHYAHPSMGSGGGVTDLGTIGGIPGNGTALGINNAGDIVGNCVTAAGAHAFLHTHGAMLDLNNLLPFGTCWTLTSATAISDSGYIVGTGYPLGSPLHAFLLTPTRTTSVNPAKSPQPLRFTLEQNYPNPFNATTVIRYSVPGNGIGGQGLGVSGVRLVVYDLLGREVAVLVNEKKIPGEYSVLLDAARLASGAYFYKLTATPPDGGGSYVATKKLILLK